MTSAVIPGTFDPPTLGHLDIIARAAKIFTKVTVIVATNPSKTPLFSAAERVRFLKEANKNANVTIIQTSGLTAKAVAELKGEAIVKGIRGSSDTEFELTQARLNHDISQVDTLLLPTNPKYAHISSSAVKEIAYFGGRIDHMVPPNVAKALSERTKHE